MLTTDALIAHASATPRRAGIATPDSLLDWQAVRERVARLASGYASIGLQAGDRVAILAENCASQIEATLAVHWVNGIVVPLNYRWTDAEIRSALEDCGASIMLVGEQFIARARVIMTGPCALRHLISFGRGAAGADGTHEELIATSGILAPPESEGESAASMFYTGGTTGRSKGVVLSHQNHVVHSLLMAAEVSFADDTKYLHAAPMFHVADALFMHLITLLGGTHYFLPRFNAVACAAAIQRHGVTDTILVPTMIQQLLALPDLAAYDFSSLCRIFYGASPIAETLVRRLLAAVPHCQLIQLYGQTEAAPVLTLLRHDDHVLEGPRRHRLRSAGRPLLATQVRIVNADDQEVARGAAGEVVARGPQVMTGYWGNPDQTASTLRGGWLHTGDAGYMDEDGYIYITDRIKDMIITGGENVYSVEVENAIYALPGVAQCAVIGVPHELWGEAVHALVVAEPGTTLTDVDVISHCAPLLAEYKRPRSVSILAEPLPLSGAGKILKRELRAPFWAGHPRGV